mmetsp:Transcript_6945/g.24299  ORF Transcript_6945/g.24299 Transcript_6945/m.24299 type:complete len:427 (-) Transcript_6945:2186-3466(-)
MADSRMRTWLVVMTITLVELSMLERDEGASTKPPMSLSELLHVLRDRSKMLRRWPLNRPPWQLGAELEELYRDCGEDSRFGGLQILGDIDDETYVKSTPFYSLYQRYMTMGPDNVSYIDESVGMFTHAELARYRCPGNGPIRKISVEEHDAWVDQWHERIAKMAPEDSSGLPKHMIFDPVRIVHGEKERDSHCYTAMLRAYRQSHYLKSFSGHSAKNQHGEFMAEPDVLFGQVPGWMSRLELDEKMRVFDARMLADMRPALERRNITAMLETVHRGLRSEGLTEKDICPGTNSRSSRFIDAIFFTQVVICPTRGLVNLTFTKNVSHRPWAIDKFGHALDFPRRPNGKIIAEVLTDGDIEALKSANKYSEVSSAPTEREEERIKRKSSYVKRIEYAKVLMWKSQEDFMRREQRKFLKQVVPTGSLLC